MPWDAKKRGARGGYYYRCVRMPDRPYPVKVYVGRGAAGHEAAAEVEARRRRRQALTDAARSERDDLAGADALADALLEAAAALAAAWLTVGGHHKHRGQWRLRHGRNADETRDLGGPAGQEPGVHPQHGRRPD